MTVILAMLTTERLVKLAPVDLAIVVFYFALVLGIGFYLKRFAKTGEDFFLAGRERTAWVAGRAVVSARKKSSPVLAQDRKSTRLNSSQRCISYEVLCLMKKAFHRCARRV